MWALLERDADARMRLSILRELSVHGNSYFPVRFVFMLLGLSLAAMAMAETQIYVLVVLYLVVDLLLVMHGRNLSPAQPRPGAAYLLFMLHRCGLVGIYITMVILIGIEGTFITQATAIILLCGQSLHMLVNRSALISLMLPDLLGMAIALPFIIHAAQGWATAEEQVIFGGGMTILLAFCFMVAFRANRLHRRLRLAAQGLEQAQKAGMIGHLTGGIAHDFNNLLTVMRGNLDLLKEVPPEERPALLAEIGEAAARGSELVARLSETGRSNEDQPDTTQVSQAVQRAACMARRTLPANVRIELYLDASAVVRGAPLDLEMVILNLLMNAADAMPEGGQIRLRVSPGKRPDQVEISVTDEGTGMSHAMIARAVEPYQTSKPPGQGTGLGLAMVKRFVDQTGGTLNIRSTLGEGTTILLTLRRVPVAVEPGRLAG